MNSLNQYETTREIFQQPRLWRETLSIIQDNKSKISEFLARASQQGPLRVILTGAGSSAFVGKSVAPYLNRILSHPVEAIATTDIVSNPRNYLHSKAPTLLISCARSGNSPESVATVKLAKQLIPNLYQIILTCNPEGALAQASLAEKNCLAILMPKDANDKGFAMTGSFTTMALTALLVFNLNNLEVVAQDVETVSKLGERLLKDQFATLQEIAAENFQRAVYLGSSTLYGLAKESALKMLELTSGRVVASADSALGFRHGPKSIVNGETNVFSFLSQDSYARKYEIDLLREMAGEKTTMVAVSAKYDPELDKLVDHPIYLSDVDYELSDDVFLTFPYLLVSQITALLKSVSMGINPDNPSPDGRVNRVVQGVKIYPLCTTCNIDSRK